MYVVKSIFASGSQYGRKNITGGTKESGATPGLDQQPASFAEGYW